MVALRIILSVVVLVPLYAMTVVGLINYQTVWSSSFLHKAPDWVLLSASITFALLIVILSPIVTFNYIKDLVGKPVEKSATQFLRARGIKTKTIVFSIRMAVMAGILHGAIFTLSLLGFLTISYGVFPTAMAVITVGLPCLLGGVVLCVTLAPREIVWDNNNLTITRIWGASYSYNWANLRGVSSFGRYYGTCSLQFSQIPLFYLGSYGCTLQEWAEFQQWVRERFGGLISSTPWMD